MAYMNDDSIALWLGRNSQGFDSKILYYDFVEVLARKASALTLGNGIVFNSDNQEIQKFLTNWFEKNRILEKLRKSEYQASMYGKVVVFLTPAQDNENVVLSILKNPFNGRVAKINEIEQVADIWNQDYQGDSNIFTRTTITPKKIRVTQYASSVSRINDVVAEIEKGLLPKTDVEMDNPFGCLPVVEIENRTLNNMFNQTQLNSNPDWAPAKGLIELYNKVFLVTNKEIVSNRTRIFGELNANVLKSIKEKKTGFLSVNDIIGDSWFNASFGADYSHGTTGSSLQVVQGDPKLTEYLNFLTGIEQKIFNACGYEANEKVNSDTYENKTASLFSNKLDKETTELKQSLRREKYYQLFDAVLRFAGKEPIQDGQRVYSFNFLNNGITDTAQEVEKQKSLLEMGLVSRAESRSTLMDEPLNIAQENIDKIDEADLESQKKQLDLQNEATDNAFKVDTDETLSGKMGDE